MRHRHVDVRRHAGRDRDRNAVRAGLRCRHLDPALLEDRAAVLEREQRAALRGLGQLHRGRLADLVLRLVGR